MILPAALPGIVGAILLAASRAIGETMIVVMGAGAAAKLSLNPFEAMTTITVKIVSQLTGDTEFASPETLVAFALGLTLFVVTLGLNIVALVHRAQIPGAIRMSDAPDAAAPRRTRCWPATPARAGATPPKRGSAPTASPPSRIAMLALVFLLTSVLSNGLARLPPDLHRHRRRRSTRRDARQAGNRDLEEMKKVTTIGYAQR